MASVNHTNPDHNNNVSNIVQIQVPGNFDSPCLIELKEKHNRKLSQRPYHLANNNIMFYQPPYHSPDDPRGCPHGILLLVVLVFGVTTPVTNPVIQNHSYLRVSDILTVLCLINGLLLARSIPLD